MAVHHADITDIVICLWRAKYVPEGHKCIFIVALSGIHQADVVPGAVKAGVDVHRLYKSHHGGVPVTG